MSLPPTVQWNYDYHPKIKSREEELMKVIKKPRNWV
jgi:coproporphyrinogen III oxidase